MTALEPGMLLVASADLLDPNFADTVVLLLGTSSEDGAMGVVLNRASLIAVADGLGERWEDAVSEPPVVFAGGPVHQDGVVGLALLDPRSPQPAGFSPIAPGRRIGYVDLESGPIASSFQALRFFAGYAGWSPGQLEGEIAEGAWFVVASTDADVHREDVGGLRRDVLRRQPGSLAWESTRPGDPALN